jgi:hypothetical protein
MTQTFDEWWEEKRKGPFEWWTQSTKKIAREAWNAASAAPQATGGLHELIVKWRTEQAEYPGIPEGLAASAAVRLCADELEAALAESQVPASSGDATRVWEKLRQSQVPAPLEALMQFMKSNLRMCKALERFVNRCPMCRAGIECQDDDCFQAREAIEKWTAAQADPAPAGLGEALNSGDGSYRP